MKQKVYSYDPKRYMVDITITSVFTGLITLACVGMAFVSEYWQLMLFIALVAGYSTWNTFLSHSNPSQVVVEEDGISFVSYGKADKYLFEDITTFLAKDFRGSGKIFVRVNKHNLFRGRYWLHTSKFSDGGELFLYILKLEHKTHPDAIKAQAWDSTRPDMDKTPYLPWEQPAEEEAAPAEQL